jgi:hypothetical protein
MNLAGLGLIVFAAILLFFLSLLQRKTAPTLRVIPALARLYRAVGLSVEDGTRLLVGLGGPSLLTRNAASSLAGLAMLRHLTERTSLSDRPPVAVTAEPSLALLAQDSLEAGYQGAGAGEYYQPTTGRVTGLTPFSAAAGTLPILTDENVSASVLVGHFGLEAALVAEAAERENTFLLGTSDDPAVQSALYASASEVLIGEELFAPGAYLGASASHTASLTVQDILRFIIIVALLAGAGLKLFGLF